MLKNKLLSAMGGAPANYIEDVFSTWLYTGNGSTQTITNGIDLAGKGGMVWTKSRNNAQNHIVNDTVRGAGKQLIPNSTLFQQSESTALTSFNSNGFSLGSKSDVNDAANTYVSWTFRDQAKFFDVVTYTGNGANRTIAHNLGSAPGCIIVKRLDSTSEWYVYHRSLTSAAYGIELNNTGAQSLDTTLWNSTAPTTSVFSLGTSGGINASGGTYVAYVYAHNAGGFGLTGNDNVISCGSYTGNGSTAGLDVTLGYEPQWVMIKSAGSTGGWWMLDTTRQMSLTDTSYLLANSANPEASFGQGRVVPTATGFRIISDNTNFNANSNTYIYIAIRRGPMKVPTTGTSVFAPVARSGTSGTATITAGFAPDVIWSQVRNYSQDDGTFDKLRGAVNLRRTSTGAEYAAANAVTAYTNTGVTVGVDSDTGAINSSGGNYGNWIFQRAPGFFDEVCYTGTGAVRTVAHNLTVVPELMIFKSRSFGSGWRIYSPAGNASKALDFTNGALADNDTYLNAVSPTSSVFTVGGDGGGTNNSAQTYVSYLFASAPGVSKVGSYTGNGSNQTINCGFTGGARFVMIKRTDSTGDWYVWDTARGIVSGNDPRLSLNTTAAEVTTDDSVDTDSTGFVVNQLSATNINVNAATYIFLAIA